MSATIKDVAKLAEVSISTVSRVINDSKPVSPEARRRVLKAIEELGYKPNEIARSLVTKKSNLIGVIVDDIGNSYVAQIVRGVEEVARMYNYDIVLCSSYGSEESELRFIQLLMQKQVEGIIIVSEILTTQIAENINKYNVPFVYLNRLYQILKTPTVTIDNEVATSIMIDYLNESGHKNILYVTWDKDIDLTIEKYKVKGYTDAIMSKGGLPVVYGVSGYKIDDSYNEGSDILEVIKRNNITAVFCGHDELAIGLINYLYDNNIRVPDDISVVGFGDISLASIYRPKLTTIKEPYYDIGAVAIRRILKEINGEVIDKRTMKLPVQLIKRESVKELNK
ncbi:LacI family DNA-binding transcriptional regulator [Tissierella sp. Yu-01]|uniref:LacI family DNA-binding transcriptional regulator n=1 Tax=Tissierella sp. Yu-01 TaxID=3035694 RepID=UPI00240DAE82|nr:LacI family DNA-binding transcriptional regulator [Tissierella sp. Yu-01]WFA09440.1 LacI family DNA-binding transcriptional regulator [Tissierella sp. Yu-01]